jgi:uncharacterized protein
MGTSNVLNRLTMTFVVTKECNLRCRYCYMVRKHAGGRMPFSVAKAAIDYLVANRDRFPQEEMVWEFIGGEPLLELELLEQILDYTRVRTYECNHPWFENAAYSISTNGMLLHDPRFQRLLDQYGSRFEIGFTIDGPEHVHDMERRLPDGRGSHAQVVKNVGLWLQRYPKGATKVTISHDTVPFVAETVLYLFSLGIGLVNSNVVFENVWQPRDDEIFEQQLDLLGDTIVKQELWRRHESSLFNRMIGKPVSAREDNNWCGAGKYMLAVDSQGLFYPCIRFADFSLAKQPPWIVGDIVHGIDQKKLQPFLELSRSKQSSLECLQCEVGSGCAWCQGFNYDESGNLYHRATYICKMHKARARANTRFWNKIDATAGAQNSNPC